MIYLYKNKSEFEEVYREDKRFVQNAYLIGYMNDDASVRLIKSRWACPVGLDGTDVSLDAFITYINQCYDILNRENKTSNHITDQEVEIWKTVYNNYAEGKSAHISKVLDLANDAVRKFRELNRPDYGYVNLPLWFPTVEHVYTRFEPNDHREGKLWNYIYDTYLPDLGMNKAFEQATYIVLELRKINEK